jgi:hypothetical protein
MIGTSAHRIASQDSGRSGETVLTTEGGQDKRAHVALVSVGCFSEVFAAFAHLAPGIGKVPNPPNILFLHHHWHIVRCADGR